MTDLPPLNQKIKWKLASGLESRREVLSTGHGRKVNLPPIDRAPRHADDCSLLELSCLSPCQLGRVADRVPCCAVDKQASSLSRLDNSMKAVEDRLECTCSNYKRLTPH
jgi:hypothetical protein